MARGQNNANLQFERDGRLGKREAEVDSTLIRSDRGISVVGKLACFCDGGSRIVMAGLRCFLFCLLVGGQLLVLLTTYSCYYY